ncbi:MAG: hypothetical protein EOO81_03270 [Oxalobacteraceae bacterium]|nr:MAG: hypothetical protein EOO81_03270 [Oxalobacteraceae bacterium]
MITNDNSKGKDGLDLDNNNPSKFSITQKVIALGGIYEGLSALHSIASAVLKLLQDGGFLGFMSVRSLDDVVVRAVPEIGEGLQGILSVRKRINALIALCEEIEILDNLEKQRIKFFQADGLTCNVVELCYFQAIEFGSFNLGIMKLKDELERTLVNKISDRLQKIKI